MQRVTAILFDFDHTLGIDHHLEHDVFAQLAAQNCAHVPAAPDIDTALARFRTGEVPLDQVLMDSFRQWGCAASRASEIPAEFRAAALLEAPNRVTPMAGVPEMLLGLRARGTTLAILSNGWTELQVLKAKLIDFPGPVFVSEQIGAWKPDRRAFSIAANDLNVEFTSILYVGDDPTVDVAGAKGAGMRAAWADFDHKEYPPKIVPPDLVIRAWREFDKGLGEFR